MIDLRCLVALIKRLNEKFVIQMDRAIRSQM